MPNWDNYYEGSIFIIDIEKKNPRNVHNSWSVQILIYFDHLLLKVFTTGYFDCYAYWHEASSLTHHLAFLWFALRKGHSPWLVEICWILNINEAKNKPESWCQHINRFFISSQRWQHSGLIIVNISGSLNISYMVDSLALVVGQGQAAGKLKLISYDFSRTIYSGAFIRGFPFQSWGIYQIWWI